MRKNLTKSLDDLRVEFHRMGGLAAEAVSKATESFIERDVDLAHQVLEEDKRVNELEALIEQESIRLIALQSPVTGDLRKIITTLKAASDLERLADHACRIAKATLRIANMSERSYEIEHLLNDMSAMAIRLIHDVMDAYVREDPNLARHAIAYDRVIDETRHSVHHLASELMLEGAAYIPASQEYIQVANCLERIGDYAKNVAGWVVYLKEGRLINHRK